MNSKTFLESKNVTNCEKVEFTETCDVNRIDSSKTDYINEDLEHQRNDSSGEVATSDFSKPIKDVDDIDVETNTSSSDSGDNNKQFSSKCSFRKILIEFYFQNEFLILVVIFIALAKAYPPIGAKYLIPHITATWIAVILIFFLSGVTLRTNDLANALQKFKFNIFVQVYDFLVASGFVYGFATFLDVTGALGKDLADGMIVCSCLPMSVNMVIVLTSLSNGDEAASILHTAVGNMLGVFLSPLLILLYLKQDSEVNIGKVFFELTLRVIFPVICGQILRFSSKKVVLFTKEYKKQCKSLQQYLLVFIVYCVFCRTFLRDSNTSLGNIFLMVLFQAVCLLILMVGAWLTLRKIFPRNPKLCVMGLFGCTNKSVATGIPLIEAIYGGSDRVGLYTLPLLVWHPMSLVLGTFLAPHLSKFVESEQKRLGLDEHDQPIDDCTIPVTMVLSRRRSKTEKDVDEKCETPMEIINIDEA